MFIDQFTKLPERIQSNYLNEHLLEEFKFALKTDVKPNATIPILWLICTKTALLICNTHKTRGLYKKYRWNDISEVRKKIHFGGHISIIVSFISTSRNDEIYFLPKKLLEDEIDNFIDACFMK